MRGRRLATLLTTAFLLIAPTAAVHASKWSVAASTSGQRTNTANGAVAPPAQPPPVVDRGIGNGINGDNTVEVRVKGKPKAPGESASKGVNSDDDTDSGEVSNDPCWYTAVPVKLGDKRINGDDPTKGTLYLVSCPSAINLESGNLVYEDEGYYWAVDGAPPIAPPPNPAQVAEQAAGRLTAPNPVVGLGPNANELAVKIPVWLWVSPQQPLTVTVAVRGLSVTVIAVMHSTTWSMGEPVDETSPAVKVPPFTCAGTGKPAPDHVDATTKPPCGYTYSWKSLADRTSGSGTWTITATTNWDVTWTASDGTSGTLAQPLTPSTTQQVAVGEWRSTLVANSGG